jgi:hypothetical protein
MEQNKKPRTDLQKYSQLIFDKETRQHNEENKMFSTHGTETIGHLYQTNESRNKPYILYKV